MTSVAWEADAFYCRGSILDTCQALLHGFLAGVESKRRADAWRTFCRYIRYVYHAITVRQGSEGAQLTTTEQGHIPALDTIAGLTDIFALICTTLLLSVIDYRQYMKTSTPPSARELGEIRCAQQDAWMLVEFLAKTIDLVKDGTMEPISLENALVSYLRLQGSWLIWKLTMVSHAQKDEVCRRFLAADFLQEDRARRMFQEMEEVWKEGTGEAPNCFTPLDQALGVGFPNAILDNSKRKSIVNLTKPLSKRRRIP
jgi:hypothetical protein